MNDMLGDGMLGGGVAAQAEKQYEKHSGKDSMCPSLSLRVRFIGFILCFFLGLIIEYVAIGAIGNADRSYWSFIIPYIIGTCLLIGSLFFMAGPKKQWEKAFDKDHRITTIIVLVFLVLTVLCSVLGWHVPMVICLIIQLGAFIWYCIMMIPGARRCCCACFGKAKNSMSGGE
mmetsp:Transcript_32239/g.43653  ORF Transcript_32239/g.43653 Transcript_32239/m.43653 type:complete len:173 (+) Transcript_32239:37-555(+)